ncbi:hypothetical protein AB0869_15005 [Micromonospora vinacea]|uniref:hypothetical protein n=1 Tax=Micromonospora vinacea TaxID=709878 RepID=UPI00345646B5
MVGLIAVVAAASSRSWSSLISAFRIAYLLTRPLGAWLGDYLSQAPDDGGLGLGTVFTSALFVATMRGLVAYLSATRRDVSDRDSRAVLR